MVRSKTLLAVAMILTVLGYEARAQDIKWSGGGLFLVDYDRSTAVNDNRNSGVTKITTQEKNVVFGMYWLDADAEINKNLSFGARLSNISASMWNALMVEGSTASSQWVTFQHAYVKFNANPLPLVFRVGLLPVDRNMEPLQAHFTPQKTSWGSFWKATMGNILGVNVQFPILSGETKIDGDVTVSKFKNGDGRIVVRETGKPDTIVPDDDSLDTIVAFAISRGLFQIKPLMAVRSPVGGPFSRLTYGFTGFYNYSPRFSISFGMGFSALSTGNPRNSTDPNAQDNRTMFLRLVPVVSLGPGNLTCDLKYSTYVDKSKEKDVLYRYPVADFKYSFKVHENLTIVFPFVRYLGEFNNNDNTDIHYSKNRLCTYIVLVFTS
jgi:hypothetical protein